jgi:hypothetical protein
MFTPSDEVLFQKGTLWVPVVDWNVSGTPANTAPAELMVSAIAAADINVAAAIILNVFIFPPMGSLPPAALETVWQLF